MPIIVNLDVMMARRKMTLSELAEKVDITPANLSILKTGKAPNPQPLPNPPPKGRESDNPTHLSDPARLSPPLRGRVREGLRGRGL